jgi:flagellar FliL protein
MAANKSKATEGDSKSKNKGGVMKIVVIALGSVLLGVVAMGALAYFIGIPGISSKSKEAKPPVMEKLDLGERVINLADGDGSRFLRVKMVLEYPQNEKIKHELEEEEPLIMESILHILRTKTVDDIRPVEKEDKVKAEIVNVINKELKSGKIERIYFTDFLIQ